MLRMPAFLSRILGFILPAQMSFGYELVLDQSMPCSVVLLSLSNLFIFDQNDCFWSLDLEIRKKIFALSFELVSCFYNLMPWHSFFLWLSTDTHISPIVDRHTHCQVIIRQCPSQPKFLWVLYLIHNALGKLYTLLFSAMLYFWACVIYSSSSWYMF